MSGRLYWNTVQWFLVVSSQQYTFTACRNSHQGAHSIWSRFSSTKKDKLGGNIFVFSQENQFFFKIVHVYTISVIGVNQNTPWRYRGGGLLWVVFHVYIVNHDRGFHFLIAFVGISDFMRINMVYKMKWIRL